MDKINVLNQYTKRFSTIIFDLDNTLIATRKADLKTCNKVNKMMHLKFSIYVCVCASFFLKILAKSLCVENRLM